MIRRRAHDVWARSGEARCVFAAFLLLLLAGCGKQGPPLPPLHLVPAAVSDVAVRRSGDEVRFTFVLPTTNANGPGGVNLARVELFAGTVAPGATAPPNRELMNARHLVGTIVVRPPAPEGKPADDTAPKDPRPVPGDRVTIVDQLDASKLQPQFTTIAPAAPVTPPTAPATATEPAEPKVATRLYLIVGATSSGRRGQPAARIVLPLVDLPAAPTGVAAKFSETSLSLSWTAAAADAKPALAFNVYAPDGTAPLNPKPLTEPVFERTDVEFGKEQCFIVRSVRVAGVVQIESAPSDRLCVTPADTFPPAAPKGLAAVASGSGVISLIWDANREADLAGYLVLRGEVPGDKLQPLTPAPIKETTFRDTTATPGVRYVYVVVAVDTAKNVSPQSPRVEESAR